MKHINKLFILILIISSGCSTESTRKTLRDIDVTAKKQMQQKVFIKEKSKTDIRKAYSDYLKFASKNDSSRLDAINRLAELEFELSSKLQKENENLATTRNDELDDRLYHERLDKTIELLSTSLKDYPNAKGNAKVLYQLAKAYDHKGDNGNSEKTLSILVKKYPKSPYYVEAQFRLAETHFSRKNYVKAEDTYTDIIGSQKNNIFYEKALFKRGWARFKQEYYLEAVDDYLAAVDYHNFDEYEELSDSQLEQFNEYFRAVGLSFSYLGGAEPLNEYFKNNPSFKYIYYSYSHVSDIYLKQQRYSDAVDTLKYFIANNKTSENIPASYLKIIAIWKDSGFAKNATKEIEYLYKNYHPDSQYWLTHKSNGKIYKKVTSDLKENILLASSYFHKLYQETQKEVYFGDADKWYKRYIQYYKSQARKDDLYYQYASLLATHKQYFDALKYYELAAYDGDIILNKNAAYATIVLSDKIYKSTVSEKNKKDMLNKHVKYATLYTQLYTNSKRSSEIILHATELAFQTQQFNKAIELADSIPGKIISASNTKANIIKAHSYFNLAQYGNAEAAYFSALSSKHISNKTKTTLSDKFALSIYKQAEQSNKEGKIDDAIEHYVRISSIVPSSSISATGFYDAIALSMKNKLWDISIKNIHYFQKLYPGHKYHSDISKKLSIAYLNSNQSIKAAQEFEKISGFEKNKDVKIAALWQAAELYESKNDIPSAIRSYEKYASSYKNPFPQYMESMNKLTALYTILKDNKKTIYWNNEIIRADKKTIDKYKTDRTRYITSFSSLKLAQFEHEKFTQQKLILPLKLSLRKKKYAMQKAVKFYGQASKYGIAETATESTYAIADIYKSFSKDLLTSQRPKGLSGEELEQYVILLEDKAFPFEDKAIEFYEANMSHIKDGVYNKWVKE
ncbi:MAG: tetratricopeptide repeat protein, partial [Gammaproteobacteria bacterium]|nr:tetratricopeptide repeat protein [Gammaproteobacteria bacterium]